MTTQKKILENLTEIELLKLADDYNNIAEILKTYFGYTNKYNYIISNKLKEYDIQFNTPSRNTKKFIDVIKTCPVCKKDFKTQKGHSKEKTTCSHSCANTHFRSGENSSNLTLDSKHTVRAGRNVGFICFPLNKRTYLIYTL